MKVSSLLIYKGLRISLYALICQWSLVYLHFPPFGYGELSYYRDQNAYAVSSDPCFQFFCLHLTVRSYGNSEFHCEELANLCKMAALFCIPTSIG